MRTATCGTEACAQVSPACCFRIVGRMLRRICHRIRERIERTVLLGRQTGSATKHLIGVYLFIAELWPPSPPFYGWRSCCCPGSPGANNEVLRLSATAKPDDLSDTTVVIPARDERDHRADVGALPARARAARFYWSTTTRPTLLPRWRGRCRIELEGVPASPADGCRAKCGPRAGRPPGRDGRHADDRRRRRPWLRGIGALKAQMRHGGYQLVSVMASLSMRSFWEKLLNPSFIYFFKMLYPFRLAKTNNPTFYSAAGGCIMLETRVFRPSAGWPRFRGELIDDCALARQVKRARFRTWIGSRGRCAAAGSIRGLGDSGIWCPLGLYPTALFPGHLLLTTFFIVSLFIVRLQAGPCRPARTGAGSAGLGDDDR